MKSDGGKQAVARVYQTELRGAGYLCSTEDQYADAITEVLIMDQERRLRVAAAARRRARRFSDERFSADFLDALRPAIKGWF